MPPTLRESLKEGLQRCALRDCRVLVGVSGGADSVALLRGLTELSEEFRLDLHVAHLDHRLRGDESTQDARWVEKLAKGLCKMFHVEHSDVAAMADDRREGIEETARKVRREWLEQTALTHRFSCIALAHTAADQAETVLHHILRGTGLIGLQGISEQTILKSGVRIVRPLLTCSRSSVIDYLSALGQEYRTDSSNSDLRYTRNRIRHELLPLLRSQYNPQVDDALRRLSSMAEGLSGWLLQQANDLLGKATLEDAAQHWRGDRRIWCSAQQLVQQEALRQIWERHDWPRKHMGHEQWRAVLGGIESGLPRHLPGRVRLEVRGQLIHLSRELPA